MADDPLFPPGAVDPGTAVLIAGPPMSRKRKLMLRLLGQAAEQQAAIVTTKLDADRMAAEVGAHWPLDEWAISYVDCVSRQRGGGGDAESVEYLTSAADLTGIGIALSGFMQAAYHETTVDRAAVGLHSLSTLLMYADLRRVYQFLHVVTGRVSSSAFVGAFTLDTTGADESRSRLEGLFDGLVELREGEDGPELRTRGAVDGPRQWTADYARR